MKKLTVAFITLLLLRSTNVLAFNPIELEVRWGDDLPIISGHTKSPILPPSLWQDDYQIIFETEHPCYTLDIVQNDSVVYSTIVSSDVTTIILPSWLEGEYELQIVRGNFCFYGTINL